jgi:hypothetical protein
MRCCKLLLTMAGKSAPADWGIAHLLQELFGCLGWFLLLLELRAGLLELLQLCRGLRQ